MPTHHPTRVHGALAPRPSRRGFTLVELIMVVVIGAVLLGVTAIRLGGGAVFTVEAERAARSLAADLRAAQSEAIATGRDHYLVFADGGTKYTGYTVWRAETGGDVVVAPARQFPDRIAVTGSAPHIGLTPGGDAIAAATYSVTSPDRAYLVTVTLATGAVSLEEVAK